MSGNGNTNGAQTVTLHVRSNEKNPIARLTIAFRKDAGNESMVQLTNPIGLSTTLYVSDSRKEDFIRDLRVALAAWEKAP